MHIKTLIKEKQIYIFSNTVSSVHLKNFFRKYKGHLALPFYPSPLLKKEGGTWHLCMMPGAWLSGGKQV